ncbi:TPA: hypothetical protein MYO83_000504 [Klebsiella michiganensis]|nr:hypothetical protein [Klebsiella michiganensis]HCB1844925.1 hypothetical protein [Klebsiella oxytoca]
MPVRDKSYHIITDNYYLGNGILSVLTETVTEVAACYTTLLDEKGGNLSELRERIAQYPVTLIILSVRCIRLRKSILNELGMCRGNVLVLSPPGLFSRGQHWLDIHEVVVIPENISIDDFLQCVFTASSGSLNIRISRSEYCIIESLLQGGGLKEISLKTGCSPRYVNILKNRLMSRIGGLTGVHGLLLCWDIIRMNPLAGR